MKVVLFNGPPRCGKDTLAGLLADKMDKQGVTTPVLEVSLSTPLRRIAYAMTGWVGELDGDDYEKFKTVRFNEFGGILGRQVMIDVSERFLKPCYGARVMTDMLMHELMYREFDGVILVRDSGFQSEIDPLVSRYGIDNVYLVRVHRGGCDFANDSREYVNLTRSANQMELYNDGDLDDLRTEAGRIYGRLVNQMGWIL